MGKVRQKYIKDIAKSIFAKYSDQVTSDFEKNKNLVREITDIKSKTIRNRVAGLLVLLNNKSDRIIISPKTQKAKDRSKRKKKRRKKRRRR